MRPPDDVRTRLRRALGDALKARDPGAASALRSAMSAIGAAVVRQEAAEREAAADERQRAGYAAEAANTSAPGTPLRRPSCDKEPGP